MTKTRKICYGCLFALAAALLVLGVFFDKTIADAMYQPENVMAKVMESVGIFPPFIFVSGLFAVLFFLIKEEDKNPLLKKVLCVIAVGLSYFVFGFMATEQLLESKLVRALIGLGTAVMLSPLTLLVFRSKSRDSLKRLSIFLIFASIVALVSSLVSINVLKYIWGRPRYREMMADGDYLLEAFTPWYQINGISWHGHHSFPSGHTCSATNLLVLCALSEVFPEAEKRKTTIGFICGIYIFAMAYSRMVLGAHFLSDVAGGFFVGLLTYVVARYVYFDKCRIVVDAIMQTNQSAAEEELAKPKWEEGERVEVELMPDDGAEEELTITEQVVDQTEENDSSKDS